VAIEENHQLTMKVFDNGIGISSKDIDELFKLKFSAKSNKLGIDLYFVENAIKKFEGMIMCESEFGSWAEFIITLPREIRRLEQQNRQYEI